MLMVATASRIGVDRDANVIFGVVLAQAGLFKTLRGRFDQESLRLIVERMRDNDSGTPCHFRHPTPANPDPLGFFLGRLLAPRLDRDRVRADLHLDRSALNSAVFGTTPPGLYIMGLIESDSRACEMSLVMKVEKKNERGVPGPPLWLPTLVDSADCVDSGDAVRGGIFGLSESITSIRRRHLHRQLQEALQEVEDRRLQQRIKKRLADADRWEAILARKADEAAIESIKKKYRDMQAAEELEELRLRWRHRKRRWPSLE